MKKLTSSTLILSLCCVILTACFDDSENFTEQDPSSAEISSSVTQTESETKTKSETESAPDLESEKYLRESYDDILDPEPDIDEVDYLKLVFLPDIDYVFDGEDGEYPIGATFLASLNEKISDTSGGISVDSASDALSQFNQLAVESQSDKYTLTVAICFSDSYNSYNGDFFYSPLTFSSVYYGGDCDYIIYSRAQIKHFTPEYIVNELLNYTKYSYIDKIVICAPGEVAE